MSDQTGKKVQLSAYAKVDAIHRWPKRHSGIPVLVRVVAPPGIGDRAPIDLVAVLDVSCATLTPENRQSMLEDAMGIVIGKLDDKDRLAIVPVQTSTLAEQTGLEKMSSDGRSNAFAKLKSLAVTGEKKLAKALDNAANILEKRPEDQKGRVSFVILISDGHDASIIEGGKINLNCSVHTFGFRDAHNVRAMHHIAKSYTGTYGILNDEHDRITEAFEASISKITSVVAVQTEVRIECSESSKATLSAIESGRSTWQIEDDRKRGKIMAGALQAGAVRNFIVYVDKVGEDELDNLPGQLKVRFKYNPASSTGQQELVDGQVVVVRQGVDRSKEVAAEIVRIEAINIVGDILHKYDDNGKALVDAADELWEQWLLLKNSEYGREAGEACLISGLATEMREMEASMRRCSGLPYMLSWQTCHTLQHQTPGSRRAAKGSQQAQTPAQLSLPPKGMACRAALETFLAPCAHAKAGADCGGGSRKRKHQRYTELEMIEQRLAYWSKVTCELPPIRHDGTGDCPDQITMIFQKASRDSMERAMLHDVFLAVVHATGRRACSCSSKSAECSSCSATENRMN